jgi:steroid 5-alpha reductase family enzyme
MDNQLLHLSNICIYIDFGEMLTWWSVYFAALPSLLATSAMASVGCVASPAFITFLLFKLSGIPLSERNNNKKYANNEEYRKYVSSTSLLVPWWKKKEKEN